MGAGRMVAKSENIWYPALVLNYTGLHYKAIPRFGVPAVAYHFCLNSPQHSHNLGTAL